VFTPGNQSRPWLWWAALPYRWIARLRALVYEQEWRRPQRLPVPVISVGNLTVGGTGKTPLVIQFTQWLLAEGKRVGVLSRGYRRTSTEPLLIVSDGRSLLAGPDQAGDEPYLIARRCPQAVVAVGADRHRLGRWVLEQYSLDCIVLDDGYQHLGLHRDANLLLLDATDSEGLDDVVPVGRLREPLTAARRATGIVITRADHPQQIENVLARCKKVLEAMPPVSLVRFQPSGLVGVRTGAMQPIEAVRGKRALLVSGVGHTGSFRRTVDLLGVSVLEEVAYPDHYRYEQRDVDEFRSKAAALKAEYVLTTEKDAGKLVPYLSSAETDWWAVRVEPEWLQGQAAIHRVLAQLVSAGPGRGHA